MRKDAVIFGLLLSCFVVFPVSAHITGQTLEKEVGEYLVDIGYNATSIVEGEGIVFDAALIQDAGSLSWHFADFDTVWVQIHRDKEVAYRTVLTTDEPMPVQFVYTFEEHGAYDLTVRFLNGETTLAEASFPLEVRSTESAQNTTKFIATSLFVILLGIVIAVVWRRRKA